MHIGEKRYIKPEGRKTNYIVSSSEVAFIHESLFPGIEVKSICMPLVKDLISINSINNYVIKESRKLGFFPIVIYPASKGELDNSFGIKLHPIINGNDIKTMLNENVLEKIEKMNKLCIIHCPGDASKYIEFLRNTFDSFEIDFIMAHMAGCRNRVDKMAKIIKAVKDTDNVYFDVSTVSESKIFSKALELCYMERLLFGTDIPATLSCAKTITDGEKVKIISQKDDPNIITEVYEVILALNKSTKSKENLWNSITHDNFKSLSCKIL